MYLHTLMGLFRKKGIYGLRIGFVSQKSCLWPGGLGLFRKKAVYCQADWVCFAKTGCRSLNIFSIFDLQE